MMEGNIMFKTGKTLDGVEGTNLMVEIEKRLREGLANTSVVIDMGECTYVNSSGLSRLVEMYQQCEGRGVALHLTNVREEVADILRITHLDGLFR